MEPWGSAIPLLVVLGLTGVLGAPTLAIYGIEGLVRRSVRASGERAVLRHLSALVWSATAAAYVWGLLYIVQDESSGALACQSAVGPQYAEHVSGYEVSFFPLHFGCQVDGVGTFEGAVPGYINPLVIVLLLAAITLTFLTLFAEKPTRMPVAPATDSADVAAVR